MTELYGANVKNMYVKKFYFLEEAILLVETDSLLYSDSFFYEERLGRIIFFDYGTVLPNKEEAHYYVEHYSIIRLDYLEDANCPYVDYIDFDMKEVLIKGSLRHSKKI